MDYKILQLLFNPLGEINKKEFKIGIIFLCILGIVNLFNYGITSGFTMLVSKNGAELIAEYNVLKLIKFPELPIVFMLFFSSIVLSIKRVRDIGWRLPFGIITGMLVFFAFSFNFNYTSLTTYLAIFNFLGNNIKIEESVKNFHLGFMFFLTILGLLMIIILLIKNGSKKTKKEIKRKKELTIFQFIEQLGILVFATFISLLLNGILIYNGLDEEIILPIVICTIFIVVLWYFLLVYKRLNNARKPFYIFVISFIVYIMSLCLTGMILSKSLNLNIINTTLSVFSFINMLFGVATILLFLLKEHEEESSSKII